MKNAFLSVLLVLSLLVSPAFAWKEAPKPATNSQEEKKATREVLWEGETDMEMLHQVRRDLDSVKFDKDIKVLKVTLLSGGGPVVTSLEIGRLVRLASEAGLIVEIHGVGLVASGATFVLASGTPGRRYISKYAIFLVHPPQVGGGFMEAPACGTFVKDPKSEREKIVNVVLTTMRDMLNWFTERPKEVIEEWLSCGYETVGTGETAVKMGIADKVE